ncbi:phosphoribosylpyrophosphate synthetase [bacterium Unc6]|nr:phosphoribosylpyrophosphate synthetase [bacterium Unc6]
MDKVELAIFSGSSNHKLTEKICKYLDIQQGNVCITNFPDGETHIKVDEDVRGRDVFIVQSTCTPVNENLVELLIFFDTLKRASARRITAIMPYFGYTRQDRKDRPRVPITAKLVANLITIAGANRVLTVDLHAGQIQGFFDIPVDHLFAVNEFVEYFEKQRLKNPVVVSPDVGGIKMARAYAKRLKASLAVVDKQRVNDREIEVMNILGEVKDRDVVIVDDLVSTAGTLVEAADALKKAGSKTVYAAVTHPVLAGPAIERIRGSSIEKLVVTDTIPLAADKQIDKILVLSIAPLLGEAIRRIHKEESVSILFN